MAAAAEISPRVNCELTAQLYLDVLGSLYGRTGALVIRFPFATEAFTKAAFLSVSEPLANEMHLLCQGYIQRLLKKSSERSFDRALIDELKENVNLKRVLNTIVDNTYKHLKKMLTRVEENTTKLKRLFPKINLGEPLTPIRTTAFASALLSTDTGVEVEPYKYTSIDTAVVAERLHEASGATAAAATAGSIISDSAVATGGVGGAGAADEEKSAEVPPEVQDIRLRKISLTNGDSHKGGQRVTILEFDTTEGDRPQKIVYKPSSLQLTARLVGSNDALSRVLPAEGEVLGLSLAERMNRIAGEVEVPDADAYIYRGSDAGKMVLPKTEIAAAAGGHGGAGVAVDAPDTSDVSRILRDPIPTLLVLPCCDRFDHDSGLTIEEQEAACGYGFLEYLEHRPNVDTLASSYQQLKDIVTLEMGAAEENSLSERVLEAVSRQVNTEVAESEEGDYIIRSTDPDASLKLAKLSWRIGAVLALSVLGKLSDLHFENVIISRLMPYLPDVENALLRSVTDVRGTMLLNQAQGGLTSIETPLTDISYVAENGTHVFSFWITTQQTNHIYYVNGTGVQRIQPDWNIVVQSFSQMLTACKADYESQLRAWYTRLTPRTLSRVVPVATSDFKTGLIEYSVEVEDNARDKHLYGRSGIVTAQLRDLKRDINHPGVSPSAREVANILITDQDLVHNAFDRYDVPVFFVSAVTGRVIDDSGRYARFGTDAVRGSLQRTFAGEDERAALSEIVAERIDEEGIVHYDPSAPRDYTMEHVAAINVEEQTAILHHAIASSFKVGEYLQPLENSSCCCKTM